MNTKSDLDGFTAILYARVSTDDKGQTNETQIREMHKWCEERGIIIEGVYEDEMTGTTLQRPAFSQAILRILTPPYTVQLLVAYDQSRLTRDERLEDILEILKPSGCKVRFVTSELDPTTFVGSMVNTIISKVDKRENDVRIAKTKMGIETRRLQGKHLGHPREFCLTEAHDSMKDGEVNEKTRYINVDSIFSFIRQGKSTAEIARILGVDAVTIRRALKRAGYWEEYQQLRHPTPTQGLSDTRIEKSIENTDTRVGSE